MTNSQTPAPRPCTLWGSTFDAKVCTKIMARFSGSGEHKGKFCLQVHGQDGCPPLVETPLAGKNERSVFSEAITAIHRAVHPPLCMKHALELVDGKPRYEFQCFQSIDTSQVYAFGSLGNVSPEIDFVYRDEEKGSLTKGKYGYPLETFDWFYPVNALGQPAHGDAERFVNVWEGE